MQELIKKLRDAVRKTPAHFDLKFDLSKLADDLENIETSNNEIDFTQGMVKDLQPYLKEGAFIVYPENINAESDIDDLLGSRDDISYFEITPLKTQLSELSESLEKLKILKDG